MTTDTPRTDAAFGQGKHGVMKIPYETSCKLECELEASKAEVERLKKLLNRAIKEIEKTPFHNPKLTAFTAHRLADSYRADMTNTSTDSTQKINDIKKTPYKEFGDT